MISLKLTENFLKSVLGHSQLHCMTDCALAEGGSVINPVNKAKATTPPKAVEIRFNMISSFLPIIA